MTMNSNDDLLSDLDPDLNYYGNVIDENHIFTIYDTVDEFTTNNPIFLNDTNSISVISQNIRSFNANLDNFLLLFDNDTMPDVFIFSETWHGINYPVIIPGCTGHHTIRQGRSGGVSIYVKNNISSCSVEKLCFANDIIEICSIKVSTSYDNLCICGIYRPHSSTIDDFSSALENILNEPTIANTSCIFSGDFNMNLISDAENVKRFVEMMNNN